jgi:hypothetical protein
MVDLGPADSAIVPYLENEADMILLRRALLSAAVIAGLAPGAAPVRPAFADECKGQDCMPLESGSECKGPDCMPESGPGVECKGDDCLPPQKNPVDACTGQDCMPDTASPGQTCEGPDCDQTPVEECKGQDCTPRLPE